MLGLERVERNNWIVIANISAACLALFCCFYFFFQNMNMFWTDLKSYMFFSPIILFCGIGFICFYIISLVGNLENGETHIADRFDLAYKIVFSVTLIMLIIRSFLGDFMSSTEEVMINGEMVNAGGTNLNVPVPIVVLAIFSGFINWFIPKIKDNSNDKF